MVPQRIITVLDVTITWNILDIHSDRYEIILDGVLKSTKTWNFREIVSFDANQIAWKH